MKLNVAKDKGNEVVDVDLFSNSINSERLDIENSLHVAVIEMLKIQKWKFIYFEVNIKGKIYNHTMKFDLSATQGEIEKRIMKYVDKREGWISVREAIENGTLTVKYKDVTLFYNSERVSEIKELIKNEFTSCECRL